MPTKRRSAPQSASGPARIGPQLAGKGWCLKITLYNICIKTYNGYIRGATIPSHVLEKLRIMTGKTIDYLLNLEPPAAGPGAGMQYSV